MYCSSNAPPPTPRGLVSKGSGCKHKAHIVFCGLSNKVLVPSPGAHVFSQHPVKLRQAYLLAHNQGKISDCRKRAIKDIEGRKWGVHWNSSIRRVMWSAYQYRNMSLAAEWRSDCKRMEAGKLVIEMCDERWRTLELRQLQLGGRGGASLRCMED